MRQIPNFDSFVIGASHEERIVALAIAVVIWVYISILSSMNIAEIYTLDGCGVTPQNNCEQVRLFVICTVLCFMFLSFLPLSPLAFGTQSRTVLSEEQEAKSRPEGE